MCNQIKNCTKHGRSNQKGTEKKKEKLKETEKSTTALSSQICFCVYFSTVTNNPEYVQLDVNPLWREYFNHTILGMILHLFHSNLKNN